MDIIVGEFTDKVSAAGNKVEGNFKETIGKATNTEKFIAQGEA